MIVQEGGATASLFKKKTPLTLLTLILCDVAQLNKLVMFELQIDKGSMVEDYVNAKQELDVIKRNVRRLEAALIHDDDDDIE